MEETIRIRDLQGIPVPSDSDRLAIDGPNGTKSVSFLDLSDTVLNKLSGAKTYNFNIGEKTIVSAVNEVTDSIDDLGLSVVNGMLCVTYEAE